MTNAPTPLQLRRVFASYDGATQVLRDLTLDAEGGELVALLGPSGGGKTTVLKVIAGLLQPSSGEVSFGDEIFNQVPAEKRGAAMVFQKPLLFPYLTVAENVAFGLKMRKMARRETSRRVDEALRLVQLEEYGARRPKELSGGQEQRVAIARALVTQPRVLLLDEPFSALDVNLRAEMRALVRQLQRQLRITTIFVTHDQEEAATIADRIALLLDGRLEQFGAPRDFYLSPRTPEAARFCGWRIIEGERCGDQIKTSLGYFALPASATDAGREGRVALAFHPTRARLSADEQADVRSENYFAGTLEATIDLGARKRYRVTLSSGALIEIEEDAWDSRVQESSLQEGAPVWVYVPPTAVKMFY